MVRSRRNDSFRSFRRQDAPFLQPTSDSFGRVDRGEIERSFLAVGRRLNSQLLYLADGLRSGDVDVRRFTLRAKGYIRGAYFAAYSLGATSVFPFYTLTDRDINILDEELSEETGFLREFARDISSGHIQLDPRMRSRLYLLALRGIFERGRIEAMPNVAYRWRLGPTEHCEKCLEAAINGPYQRTRNSGLGLPILPGSPGDGSICLGLTRCGCRIVLDNGQPLPNEDLADRMRGLLLEAIDGIGATAS